MRSRHGEGVRAAGARDAPDQGHAPRHRHWYPHRPRRLAELTAVPPGRGQPSTQRLRRRTLASARHQLADARLLVVSWLLLGLTRVLTLVLPFRMVRHLLGEPRATVLPDRPARSASGRDRGRGHRIGVLVTRAAGRTPWRSDCYPQALTARLLLRAARIPHRVSFGVRRDGGDLAAHAWVDVDGVPVTGGDGQGWTTVGSFTWSPGTRAR